MGGGGVSIFMWYFMLFQGGHFFKCICAAYLPTLPRTVPARSLTRPSGIKLQWVVRFPV